MDLEQRLGQEPIVGFENRGFCRGRRQGGGGQKAGAEARAKASGRGQQPGQRQ